MLDVLFYEKYGRQIAQALLKLYYAALLRALHSRLIIRGILRYAFIIRALR